MRKISKWAKNHKWAARFSIAGIHITLNFLAVLCGLLLFSLKVDLPIALPVIAILTLFGSAMAYPSRRKSSYAPGTFYKIQKTFDAIIVAATFCMVLFIGNHFQDTRSYFPVINATKGLTLTHPADTVDKKYKSILAFQLSMRDENGKSLKWKEKKKLLKEQVRGIKNSKELSDGSKTGLIILSIIVALGLLFLVAALSCNLSCSGSDAAALLVGVLGVALVVFLLIKVIRRINHPKKTVNEPAPKEG